MLHLKQTAWQERKAEWSEKMVQQFEFQELALKGAYLIHPFYAEDERGGLIKDYHEELFSRNGIMHSLKETFYTISKQGVIRALHFQEVKEQAKLIRCIKGTIYDVIVDLRPESETFKEWLGFELSEENRLELYVPQHFGHGYLVLEDSVVSYKCGEVFYGEYDTGIRWNDETLNIQWPLERIGGREHLILSEKDQNLSSFEEYFAGKNNETGK